MSPKAKGGVRQRLGLDARKSDKHTGESDVVPVVEVSAASSSGRRGGIRSRVGVGLDDDGGTRSKRKCTGPLVGTLKKQ